MAARLPLLHKTPFVLDERPLFEATSPHAGALSLSRAFRALGLPELIGANLTLRKRQRGFCEAQFIEAISLLQAVGGECPEDIGLLCGDECLERGLGYQFPKVTAVREFLERFHDKALEKLRPRREVQKSFIFPSSGPVKHPDREQEPGGRIGFAVSAVMSEPLAQALRKVKEAQWKTFGKEEDGTLRQWAEVDFVPAEKYERKDSQPLRYVGLRLLKPQGVLFKDGTDRHFHAVLTNQTIDGGRLLDWHRQKAGTVEHTHDEVKNELGGAHVPSQRFGVNSVWFKISLLTYNIISAIKGLCLEAEERRARMKKLRLLLIHVAGRMNRNNCVMGLRLCNNAAALKRMQKVWEVFELPTQATSAKALGKPSG